MRDILSVFCQVPENVASINTSLDDSNLQNSISNRIGINVYDKANT